MSFQIDPILHFLQLCMLYDYSLFVHFAISVQDVHCPTNNIRSSSLVIRQL
jgi:hypothetical protein